MLTHVSSCFVCRLEFNQIGPEGAKAVADALLVNGSLTNLSIYGNSIMDEGVGGVCEAIQNNKATKLASLNIGYNEISQVGAKSVAAMLAVTGSLTCCNVLRNQMDIAAAKSLVEAVKDKDISLAGIKRDQTIAKFEQKKLKPPDAVLLASDLSKAGVSGSLTNLS